MTATGRRFGRFVQVTYGRPGGTAVVHDGLNVRFDVSMDDGADPNKATITIDNVSDGTLAALQEPDAFVSLRVGYGSDQRQIFTGSPVRDGVRGGRGAPLVIEAEDGGRIYRTARVNRAYSGETSIADALADVILDAGYDVGRVELPSPAPTARTSLQLHGPIRNVLDRFASSYGLRWFVRDGAVFVLPRDADTGEEATVFSVDARNLVGTPVLRDRGVEVVGLIAPAMRPRRLFRVESPTVSGLFVARSVQFSGESGFKGGDFFVRCKGVPR